MKQKLKLINETKWDTKSLKKLCQKVFEKAGGTFCRIEISYTNRNYYPYHGLATVGGTRIWMYVPYPKKDVKFDVARFAQILEHEIDHNLGLRHKDMIPSGQIDVDYVGCFIVNPKSEKEKPAISRKELNHQKTIKAVQRTQAAIKQTESRLKRLHTLLKKYQKQKKRYEPRPVMPVAALPSPAVQESTAK